MPYQKCSFSAFLLKFWLKFYQIKNVNLSHHIKNDICVVNVEGAIIGQAAIEFKTHVVELLRKKEYRGLVINCQEIHEIRSAGLGYLAMFSNNAEKMQKKFALFQLTDVLRSILRTTNLDRKILIFDTEEDAVANF